MENNFDEDSQVININAEDIEDNLNNILENSNTFKKNSNVNLIRCVIFYVDAKNVISFKKYEITLKDNVLPKSELVTLILENKKSHSKEFDLTGIYKFEINLKEDEIKSFCKSPESYSFMKQYKSIQDIKFSPGIELLNDANNVILFFTKKTKTPRRKTEQAQPNKTRKKVKFITPKPVSEDQHTNNKTSKNMT
uniref:Uncharacterized protein n=1 Tax=viral metagenome TaxID=1070528 RepID=A0A6C0KXC1_9ZZZZ|tara:strand:+ start:6805 stop:7386 length:582 start_codon:yes stop_codon:yes gene_type:complete